MGMSHGKSYCNVSWSHTVKINVFMTCIFIIFKLVYFTTVNLDLHFKYKVNVFSHLNDLFHLPFFFGLGSSKLFLPAICKIWQLLLAIGSPLFQALNICISSHSLCIAYLSSFVCFVVLFSKRFVQPQRQGSRR